MQICIVSQQYKNGWSGVGTYSRNLVDGLAARGHSIQLIAPEAERADYIAMPDSVMFHPVKTTRIDVALNYWLPLAVRFRRAITKVLARHDCDLVHFTDAREAIFCPQLQIPVTGMVNDYYAAWCPRLPWKLKPYFADWPIRYAYYQLQRLIEPQALRKCQILIANSRFVAGTLTDTYSIPRDKISVVPYGIDPVEVEHPNKLPGNPSLLFVGSNFQRKGIPTIVRALAKIREKLPDTHLHIVGHDSNQNVIEDIADELGVRGMVTFHGRLGYEKVRSLVADIFVMPSLIEGVGMVFLEAMSAGVPVIAGRVGGTVEVVTDGQNGITVPPSEEGEVANAIIKLSTDDDFREQCISAGHDTVKKFSIGRMLNTTEGIFKDILERSS